jgi:sialate O-acetylesterase
MRLSSLLLPLALLLANSGLAAAQDLKLPSIFSDHMVLQAQSEVPVWGMAAPGASVQLSGGWWPGDLSTKADANGKWQLELRSPQTGGPFSISVSSQGETITYKDVLLGEVWLCGGQSNMEWTLGPGVGPGIADWKAEVAGANFPQIRLHDVPHKIALAPQWQGAGTWRVCSPQTVSKFSAVGYLFGRDLHQELEVPIGLISCNWGGTVAEAWTSAETLQKMKDFAQPMEAVAQLAEEGADEQQLLSQRRQQWWQKLNRLEKLPALASAGRSGNDGSGAKNASATQWQAVTLPGAWAGDLANFDGVVWYRREFQVPKAWVGKSWMLELGPIDDYDTIWLNRQQVAATHAVGKWNTPRRYKIDSAHTIAGKCTLSVRVVDPSGGGGFIGKAEQMKIYLPGDPQTAVSLAGEWQALRGSDIGKLGAFPSQTKLHPNLPTVLHNGMLRPVIPYAIRGAIWYQGESNRTRAKQYQRLFPNMIADWRRLWGRGDFPFYFVQIAPYQYGGDQGQAAALREAQTMALSVKNTGMAVTMDIGNPGNIHPTNKQSVAQRLALWAKVKTYPHRLRSKNADSLEFSGPMLDQVVAKGGILKLSFHHGAGLQTRDGKAPSHFVIAGKDRVFHAAKARIVVDRDGGSWVWLQSDAVAEPVAARYAWGAADEPNLENHANLPAPSFRTDQWQPHP